MSAPSHSRAHLVAVVTAIVVTVLWSSSWILIRAGLDDEGLHPLSFAGLRYGLAALVLMGVVALSPSHRQEVRSVGPRATLQLAILGTIYYTLTQGAQFVAIDNQPAATTSLVLAMTPLLVAYSSGRSLGERAGAGQFVGAVLVIAGAALYLAGDLGATAMVKRTS